MELTVLDDWQSGVVRLLHRIEQVFDRVKYKLGPRLRGGNKPIIVPYLGFGSPSSIYLKGRVLEDTGITTSKDTDRIWNNLLNMYRRFESDEIPYARVLASFRQIKQEIVADEEGYFDVSFRLKEPLVSRKAWEKIDLELLEPRVSEGKKVHAEGQVLIVSPEAEYGVISDIDDTVVYTGVTSRLKMAGNIFLRNARTRLPLEGVATFYHALQQGKRRDSVNPLFYVSSSPWNIYDLFQEFFQIHGIPTGPIFFRDWGLARDSLLSITHRKFKLDAICKIVECFPDMRFILIGDSGEEDPEIYSEIIHMYPGRILVSYIRSVRRDPHRLREIQELAQGVDNSGSAILLFKDTQEMAIHAAQQGWISLPPAFQPAE
jgi:phosphatidate phosphatase APP1